MLDNARHQSKTHDEVLVRDLNFLLQKFLIKMDGIRNREKVLQSLTDNVISQIELVKAYKHIADISEN